MKVNGVMNLMLVQLIKLRSLMRLCSIMYTLSTFKRLDAKEKKSLKIVELNFNALIPNNAVITLSIKQM